MLVLLIPFRRMDSLMVGLPLWLLQIQMEGLSLPIPPCIHISEDFSHAALAVTTRHFAKVVMRLSIGSM